MSFRYYRRGPHIPGSRRLYTDPFHPSGLFIALYIVVGIFYNTAPPHLPAVAFSVTALHSWIQYLISIFLWPLSFWHPLFSVSQWPAGSTP